jgi:TfuA protein
MTVFSARPVVYVGPCLEERAVYARLGDRVDVRPPIRAGDLDALPPAVKIVAIIDGVFHTQRAVGPREILNALRRGVRIFGSSSMGALRAAELDRYGMVGVGEVYRMYVEGTIESDADVALAFDPETLRAISEPMVNVRYAVERARESGVVSRDDVHALIEAARALYFYDRSVARWLREARRALSVEVIDRFAAYLRERGVDLDLKRADALALLRRLEVEFAREEVPS